MYINECVDEEYLRAVSGHRQACQTMAQVGDRRAVLPVGHASALSPWHRAWPWAAVLWLPAAHAHSGNNTCNCFTSIAPTCFCSVNRLNLSKESGVCNCTKAFQHQRQWFVQHATTVRSAGLKESFCTLLHWFSTYSVQIP